MLQKTERNMFLRLVFQRTKRKFLTNLCRCLWHHRKKEEDAKKNALIKESGNLGDSIQAMIVRQAQRKEQEAKNKLALDLQIAKNQNAKRQSEAEKKADKEKVLQELKAYEDEQQPLK